jgi:dienelactone hydrolase
MSELVHTQPAARSSAVARLAAFARTEAGIVSVAAGVVALHVVDDSFIQPNPGTSAGDHLFGGLVPLALFAGAAVLYGRVRAGAQAAIALVLGFLGVLFGTEAVHYTREVGPSEDDFTGLMSIPAGLVLVGVGVVKLWKSRKTTDRMWWRYSRRLLVTAAVAASVPILVIPVALSYVVTHAARPFVTTADLGAPYEDVEFTTSDGLRLKGWYIKSKNGAAVIAFPGRAGSQKRAKMMADHGYGVLLFDRRGEGESEGDPNLFGWQGERDIHAAVKFLQSRPDVDPERIGGIGLSVGGEMMMEAAAESGAIKAIMSEGGSGRSVRDIWANPDRKWPELLGNGVATAATALFTDNLPPRSLRSLAPEIQSASFFVYGERGQSVEEPANTAFYEEARGPKELWEVPGSGHMKGTEAQPDEYERRVVGFFDRVLLNEGGGK